MRPFPAHPRHDPNALPAAHPLTVLMRAVEAQGGTVAAGPGTIGSSGCRPVPTVLVELGGREWCAQAPTYRACADRLAPCLEGV